MPKKNSDLPENLSQSGEIRSPDQMCDKPDVSVKAWQLMTEAKITDAINKGDLPNAELGTFQGFGKPIEQIDSQVDAEIDQLRNDTSAGEERIPPAMQLRRDVATGLLEIMKLPSEELIEPEVDRLNDLIDMTKENLSWGPPVTTTNLDLPTVIMRWRQVQQENAKLQKGE